MTNEPEFEDAEYIVWSYSDGYWSPRAVLTKAELIEAIHETYGSRWKVTGPALQLRDLTFARKGSA